MSQIPAQVSPEQFQHYIWPYLYKGQAQTGQPDSTIQQFHPSYQYNTQNKDLIFEMKAYSLDLRNRVIETYKQGRLKKTEIGRKYRICYQTVCAVPG